MRAAWWRCAIGNIIMFLMAAAPDPEQQLEFFIDRYTPEIAALARRLLARMRARLPGAVEFVYDNYSALAIPTFVPGSSRSLPPQVFATPTMMGWPKLRQRR